MATKRSKKGEGESRREDETRDELTTEMAVVATQDDEGALSKKAKAARKKATMPTKTASQIREELNLDAILPEPNVEQGVVDQAKEAKAQPNVPSEVSEEVESEESEKDSDREGPRRRETPIAKNRNEFREMKAIITSLAQQNQMLLEMVQKGRSSSSDGSKPTYMKNVPKPTTWDTKDKSNIDSFLTEYETYCDASGYIGDEV